MSVSQHCTVTHPFKASFCQSSKAAAKVNTKASLQISSYPMLINDSKERQLVTKEGKQILSPVP